MRTFNLSTERLKRSDLPGKVNIPTLLNDNLSIKRTTASQSDLKPYCFYTDGGTYNDDIKYFVHNIFSSSGVCHSTKIPTNANLQLYVGRHIEVEPSLVQPKDHKVKGKTNDICLPYQEHYANPEEEETFKILNELEIKNMGSGYTCFVKTYMFFTSCREVKIAKNPEILKFLRSIHSIEKFEALGLPIKKKT